jgi:cell division protein FtsB
MDQDSQNQSIDGMKPLDGNAPASGVDGFMAPQKTNFNTDDLEKNNSSEEQTPAPQLSEDKKSSKAKIWIIILAILFVVAAAVAGYLYMQYSSTKKDLDTAKQASSQTTTQKQEVDKLTQQNADLQKTVNSQTEYINSLLKISTQLKTTCGNACASIVVPPAPSGIPTPTPTSTVKTSPTPTATTTPKPTVTP